MISCPFCTLAAAPIVAENDLAVALRDVNPVNPGHTLIVPRRHVASWFAVSAAEQAALLSLLAQVKQALDDELHPAGYNIGCNDGAAAGQTVDHLHLHLIPRFDGDVDDPTGGVRLVIPERGNYRSPGSIPKAREPDVVGANPRMAADIRRWLTDIDLTAIFDDVHHETQLFERASQRFLHWLADMGFRDNELCDGHLSWLARRLRPESSENAAWARVFIDLWYCANFTTESYRSLIARDHRNIGRAAEACFYVEQSSGASGVSELEHLIHEFDCAGDLEEYVIRHYDERAQFRRWIVEILTRMKP